MGYVIIVFWAILAAMLIYWLKKAGECCIQPPDSMENLCNEELFEILHRYRKIAKQYGYKHPDWTEAQTVLRDRIRKKLDPQFYENPTKYVEELYSANAEFNRIQYPRSKEFWKRS